MTDSDDAPDTEDRKFDGELLVAQRILRMLDALSLPVVVASPTTCTTASCARGCGNWPRRGARREPLFYRGKRQ